MQHLNRITGYPALLSWSRACLDWWETVAQSRTALGVMFLWAVGEAMVWPIIPEALLVPMAAGAGRAFPRVWAAAVLGAALGSVAMYAFSLSLPTVALALLAHIPGAQDEKMARAATLLAERGPGAFWAQPWTGIPFKVFAVLGALQHLDIWQAIPISISARGLRMAVTGGAVALVAWPLRRFVRDFFLLLAAVYLVSFGYGWWITQM